MRMGIYMPGPLRVRLVAEGKRSRLKHSTLIQLALEIYLKRAEEAARIKGKK